MFVFGVVSEGVLGNGTPFLVINFVISLQGMFPQRARRLITSQTYVGAVSMFAGTFAPRTTAFCSGQLLPINQNTALFAVLGTTYMVFKKTVKHFLDKITV